MSQELSNQQPPVRVEVLTEEEFLRLVWGEFADIFGRPWFANRGAMPAPSWCEAISKLNRAKVVEAVRSYAKPDQTPPDLPKFLARYKALIPAIPPRSLPTPPPTPEQRERIAADLQKLHAVIKRNSVRQEFRKPEPVKPFNDVDQQELEKRQGAK